MLEWRETPGPPDPPRASDLLARATERADRRRRKLAEREGRETARRVREEAEARERRLDALVEREEEGWARVEALIGERKPASYDEAVRLLRDLRALAARAGRGSAADAKLESRRQTHARKSTFVDRLERAGLTRPTV